MASGVAMRRASSAASKVPKSNGHTKATKLEAPYSASGGAVKAGRPSTVRKIATPASASRISRPAARVVPAKRRSPGRCLARLVDAVTCADTGIGSPLGTGRADEGDAPSARPFDVRQGVALILSATATTPELNVDDRGAEPAVLAAAAWPSLLSR